MADTEIDLLPSFVWGEAGGLTAQGNEPDKSQDRLWSVLAFIAKSARPRGLLGQMKRAGNSVATEETGRYDRMKEAVKRVVEEKYDGPVLPQQAALWQIDADGRPLFDASDASRAPPSWIFTERARQGGDFSSKAGLRYRLFELVDPPAATRLGYVSSHTSTGLTIRKWAVSPRVRGAAWFIGIAASLLFVLAGILVTRTGRIDGSVRSQLTSTNSQYDIVRKLAENCISDQKLFPKWKRSACSFLADGDGKYVMPPVVKPATTAAAGAVAAAQGDAEAKAKEQAAAQAGKEAPKPEPQAENRTEAKDSAAAKEAAAAKAPPAKPETQISAKAALASPGANQAVLEFGEKVGDAIAMIGKCLNIGVVAPPEDEKPPASSGAGSGTTGADDSANDTASCELIARSAASLAPIKRQTSFLDGMVGMIMGVKHVAGTRSILLQLLCAVLGIAGLAIALGLGTKGRVDGIWIDERNRVSLARAQVTLWTIVALGGFATIALFNIGLGAPTSFPQIPVSIAAALGIAFTSPMVSAFILNFKGQEKDAVTRELSRKEAKDVSDLGSFLASGSSAGLEARDDPTEASIADVFMGEKVSEADNIDISRLQNVLLTVILVLGYFAMLTEQLRTISPDSILSGLASLPDPGAAFTAVLLVSHATYLGTKAFKTSGSGELAT